MSSNYLWSNLQLINLSLYSFWDHIPPFSSQNKGIPLLNKVLNSLMNSLIWWLLEQGPTATRKATISEQESQRKLYLKRPRRESSTTTLKAAVKTGGLNYPHKGKGAMGRGIEDKGNKGSDQGSGAHTHDQRQEAWKTTESCSVTSKRQSKVQIGRLSQLGFLGYCWDRPTVLYQGETFEPPI